MNGSEKQVAWAEDIKKVYEQSYNTYYAEVPADLDEGEQRKTQIKKESAERTLDHLIDLGGLKHDQKKEAFEKDAGYDHESIYKAIKSQPDKETRKAKRHELMKQYKPLRIAGDKAFADWYKEQIETALKNDDAKFWIDKRLRGDNQNEKIYD